MSTSVSHPPAHFRMTTEILPQITTPDRLETRLGPLTFTDGFPDDATVQKVYDNLDFHRGAQAFLTAMPAASLAAIRKGITGFGPANETVILVETLMDSRSLFLRRETRVHSTSERNSVPSPKDGHERPPEGPTVPTRARAVRARSSREDEP